MPIRKKAPASGGLDSRASVPRLLLLARFDQAELLLDIMNARQGDAKLLRDLHAGLAALQGDFDLLP